MSEHDTSKFEVQIADDVVLRRDSMVAHIEHGPMHVDRVIIGPYSKTVKLSSETGPIGLELTEDELREEWGETIHTDPFELHEPGTSRFGADGITVEDSGVEASLTVSGPSQEAEFAYMYAKDKLVRAIQAVESEQHPDDCEGIGFSIDWASVFSDEDGDSDA